MAGMRWDFIEMSKTISFASLFSGIGGADLGLQSAGLEHAWGLEYEAPLAELYTNNIGRCFVQNILDANPIKFDKVDWLHASPVCKAFSTANTNKGERQLDLDCAQKTADFIKVLEPRWVSIENVEAYRKSKSFHLICDQLGKSGYWFTWKVLNAADFGVPQARRRLILTACKSGFLPEMPQPEKWIGWYNAIEDLLADLPDSKLADWQIKRLPDLIKGSFLTEQTNPRREATVRYGSDPAFTLASSMCARRSGVQAFLVHPTDQRTMPTIEGTEPAFTLTANESGNITKALLIESTGARSDRPLAILEAEKPCWTLRAMGHDGHWHKAHALISEGRGRVVQLDIKCLARLQSFPDTYRFSGTKSIDGKGIGNSVCPLMMKKIAENILGVN